MNTIKLTQYSHGAGCGCKIAPSVLETILKTETVIPSNGSLLVGNQTKDDAAVYDLNDGTALICTTDFFMPIVDDPEQFGKIAAANAISDIYAMGGSPLVAIAILGWPVDRLSPEIAQKVLEGGRKKCAEAGIPLAGGHSIDSPEPIFGLAVTGRVDVDKLKRNDTATAGCELLLTKPIGVGVLTTAEKQGKLKEKHNNVASSLMEQLNTVGESLSVIEEVKAMTDVTGFGLLGHLTEMCEGSGLSAEIEIEKVPFLEGLDYYLSQKCIPGGTYRNWKSYGEKIQLSDERQKFLLCDPQTSGGLLVAVSPEGLDKVKNILQQNGIEAAPFGRMIKKENYLVKVK